MKLESLRKIRELVIQAVNDSDINQTDKVELLINLYHFLDEREYERAIMLLQRERKPHNEIPIHKS